MLLFELPFPKPTPFELKKSFLDKNTVLSLKKRRLQLSLVGSLKKSNFSRAELLKYIFTCLKDSRPLNIVKLIKFN